MNQTLSASAGAGSILNIGSASEGGAGAGVPRGGLAEAGAGEGLLPSFNESMRLAQGKLSGAEGEKSGHVLPQNLPDDGEILPRGSAGKIEQSVARVVDPAAGKAVDESTEYVSQQLELNPLQQKEDNAHVADSGLTNAKSGSETLSQIDRYRRADLAVAVDSALKQLGAGQNKAGRDTKLLVASVPPVNAAGSARSTVDGQSEYRSLNVSPDSVAVTSQAGGGAELPLQTAQISPAGVLPEQSSKNPVSDDEILPVKRVSVEKQEVSLDQLAQPVRSDPQATSAESQSRASQSDLPPVLQRTDQSGVKLSESNSEFARQVGPERRAQRVDVGVRSDAAVIQQSFDSGVVSGDRGPESQLGNASGVAAEGGKLVDRQEVVQAQKELSVSTSGASENGESVDKLHADTARLAALRADSISAQAGAESRAQAQADGVFESTATAGFKQTAIEPVKSSPSVTNAPFIDEERVREPVNELANKAVDVSTEQLSIDKQGANEFGVDRPPIVVKTDRSSEASPQDGADRAQRQSFAESLARPQQSDLNNAQHPQAPRPQNDSVQPQASALMAGQLSSEEFQQKLKTLRADTDKSNSVELGGRSEVRQDSQLTSFADSLAAAAKSTRTTGEAQPMVMPHGVRPGMPSWGQAVNDRVMLMASKNGQFAEIQLDPPELGSLQVKLQVKHDQVSVVFNTPHGAVRDALEQSMPRLREMFAEQGLNLSESSVEDHSGGQQREGAGSGSSFAGYQGEGVDESRGDIVQSESLSLVDYYA